MTLFLLPHDEHAKFDLDAVKRLANPDPEIPITAALGAALEWSPRSGSFTCELSDSHDAIWADTDRREAFDYLFDLAGKLLLRIDMSDHEYTFLVHLHDHKTAESAWRDAMAQQERAT
jgi:hypothetical protein